MALPKSLAAPQQSGLDIQEKLEKLLVEKYGQWTAIAFDNPAISTSQNKARNKALIDQFSFVDISIVAKPTLPDYTAKATQSVINTINTNSLSARTSGGKLYGSITGMSNYQGDFSVSSSNNDVISKLQDRIKELECELAEFKKNKTHETFSTDKEFDALSAYDRAKSALGEM